MEVVLVLYLAAALLTGNLAAKPSRQLGRALWSQDGPSYLSLAVTLGACDHHGPADLMLNQDLYLTPYEAQSTQTRPCSAIDGRTVCHPGCGQSTIARRRIEQVLGLIKQAAWQSQLKPRGRSRVGAVFRLHVVT